MISPLRGAAAPVGIAPAGWGEAPGCTELDLRSLAAAQALAEAGLRPADVAGLATIIEPVPRLRGGLGERRT